jgi:hypothetical protein
MTQPDASDAIVRQFLTRSLPKALWTHQAHLRVGLWHALKFTRDQALDLLRERIRAYNEATGVANTEQSGYHETITRFYLWAILAFIRGADIASPFDDLVAGLIARHGERDEPLRYYSRQRLFSALARREWLEPDLAPLPPDW